MKIFPYTRVEKSDTVALCNMKFNKDATVTLDFGKNEEKLKLPTEFLYDSIEHYLTYILEQVCLSKKVPRKK
jgi:hypothetical protein